LAEGGRRQTPDIGDIEAFTFTSLLSEVAHRLILTEAATLPGSSGSKVLNRLKHKPSVIPGLTVFQKAVDAVLQSRMRVIPVPGGLVSMAATLSRQHSPLTDSVVNGPSSFLI